MPGNGRKRFRLRHEFWLDMNSENEAALSELIAWLKDKRKFHQCVTKGLWIAADLEEGKLDALFRFYPTLKQLIGTASNGGEYLPVSASDTASEIEFLPSSPDGGEAAVTNFLDSLDSL